MTYIYTSECVHFRRRLNYDICLLLFGSLVFLYEVSGRQISKGSFSVRAVKIKESTEG